MALTDLKNVFHYVAVAEYHQKHLKIIANEHVKFTCMSNGMVLPRES